MNDISSAVQKEVARLRDMIATTNALIPNGSASFIFYEMAIAEAERAVREQDAVALIKILSELRDMQ
jgi:hypothetical protein